MQNYPEDHPFHHTQKIQKDLQALIDHLREDIKKVEDPKAEALFETSAEVLQGLKTAYHHYEKESEEAWQ